MSVMVPYETTAVTYVIIGGNDGPAQLLTIAPGHFCLSGRSHVTYTEDGAVAIGAIVALDPYWIGADFPDWSIGIDVAPPGIYGHNGTLYECRQAHTTQVDWPPDRTPALWLHRPLPEPGEVYPPWDHALAGTYALDDFVAHAGRNWRSLMSANSYEPGVVGTWRDQSDPPLWVAPAGSVGLWHVDDVAEHTGLVWRCTVANNTWEPGVYGWEVLG